MDPQNAFAFENLEAWKKARKIKLEIAELVNTFPSEEKYRLVDQLIRCTRSIGNLIAEGHGRFGYQDQIRFCVEARGSLTETMGHLIDAFDAKYISEAIITYYRAQLKEAERLLNGYINYLRKQRDAGNSK